MSKNEINDPVIIEGFPAQMSAKSIRFNCEGDLVWLPKSQINFDAEKKEIEMPKWLARKTFPNEGF